MFSVVEELLRTRRELSEVKDQLRIVSQFLNKSKSNFVFLFSCN